MIEQALIKTLGFGSKEFIERAIAGGCASLYQAIGGDEKLIKPITEILLDPAAWRAIGKVEGWFEHCMDCGGRITRHDTPEYPNLPNGLSWCPMRCPDKKFREGYVYEMHRFIDALAEEDSSKA